ncbi:MAG TPA: OmpA family protein [Hyphomicrobiaceae bacterium]|nr:OmpA family protein [Hyphomicrobiaceae bacterium]
MKKLNKVALMFASAALLSGCGVMSTTGPVDAGRVVAANGGTVVDNWQNGTGQYVWRNGTNELCWRDANWTPATAAVGCDGALVRAAAVAAPAPVAVVPPPPAAAPAPAPRPPAPAPQPPAATKVTYAADAFFDFDKAVLKPEGRAKLDDLVGKIQGINLEVIIAVGHTDAVGNDSYNQRLSVRRAEAVKNYLVSKGIEKNRVYTEGKGEKQPVADNKTAEGRAKNRRVEIEVVGTRANR